MFSLGCFFSFPAIPKRELFVPLFALSFFRNEVFARPLPWVPHVVMALSCCHSFALPGLFFKIFIQNVVILLLGAVLTHPWAFWPFSLLYYFLWTYPLELCSFHLWEGVGFICSCRLNFFSTVNSTGLCSLWRAKPGEVPVMLRLLSPVPYYQHFTNLNVRQREED